MKEGDRRMIASKGRGSIADAVADEGAGVGAQVGEGEAANTRDREGASRIPSGRAAAVVVVADPIRTGNTKRPSATERPL